MIEKSKLVNDLKLSNLGAFRFLFIILSSLIFVSGYIECSFNFMLLGVLILWICGLWYCLENFNCRFLLMIFYFMMFVFFISRPTIDLLKGPLWNNFNKNQNLFSLLSVYISMFCLIIGNWVGEKFVQKKQLYNSKPLSIEEVRENSVTLQTFSICLFYISVVMLFAVEFEKLFYMNGRKYEEIYVSFRSELPYFVNVIASMNKYFLCIFLATMPKKSKTFIPLGLYVISTVPYFIIGARYKLVVNMLFVIVYYLFRDSIGDKEKWIGFKEKFILCVGSPLALAFLGAYNYIREGRKMEHHGILGLIADFFYKQGVSFDVLRMGYGIIPKIKYTGFVNYSFGEILDYLMHGKLAQFLWDAKPFAEGQNEALGLYSNLLAYRLSYTASRSYFLAGHGWGSSYLLDTYADWNYLGIIIFSFFLGIIFAYMIYWLKKSNLSRIIVLVMLTSIYYSPRSSAFAWVSFLVYLQFYVPLIMCLLCVALFTKSYTIKNHLQ